MKATFVGYIHKLYTWTDKQAVVSVQVQALGSTKDASFQIIFLVYNELSC
jgi:hypothetical protein